MKIYQRNNSAVQSQIEFSIHASKANENDFDQLDQDAIERDFELMLYQQAQEYARVGSISNIELKFYVLGSEYHDNYYDSHKLATTEARLKSEMNDFDWHCQGYAYHCEITAEEFYDDSFKLEHNFD